MAGRADFTDEEWAALAHAQLAAAVVVSAAEHASRSEFVDEMYAVLEELRDRSVMAENPLVRQVAGEHSVGGEPLEQWNAESEEHLLDAVRRAAELVASRAPEDATAFRQHLVAVAERAAHAVKHGGFLGIGGTRVTAEERAAVEKVRAASGLT